MTITLANESAQVYLRSYAHTENGLLVWLEIAPQHPKLSGAIWSTLVNGHRTYLQLKDDDKGLGRAVYGLGRAYIRLEADAPTLAVAAEGKRLATARPKLLRLVAPDAVRPTALDQPFYALAWPGVTPEVILAATLERAAPYPVQTGWGPYLLAEALRRGLATPLVAGSAAPQGYEISGDANWPDVISQGLQTGQITLEGACAYSLDHIGWAEPAQVIEAVAV